MIAGRLLVEKIFDINEIKCYYMYTIRLIAHKL